MALPSKRSIGLLVALAALLVVAVPAGAQDEPAHVHVIDGGDPFFSPFETTILRGGTVEWDNHADRIHTVTHVTCKRADARFDDCEFDSVFTLEPGTTFSHTFATRSGVFDYKCTIHGFTGRVVVLDEPGAVPDLTVDALEAFGTPTPTNLRLQATVRNAGAATAPTSRIRFQYQNLDGTWHDIGEPSVPVINPGATVVINQTWLVANKAGDFPVRAVVDSGHNLLESDEDNNARDETVSVHLPPGVTQGVSLPDPP